jgi:competence protein ComEA
MTNGERKALVFLAGVGVLGAGARLASAPARVPTAAERAALDGQIAAVDSARHASRRGGDRTADQPRRPRSRRRAGGGDSLVERVPRTVIVGPSMESIDVDAADAATIEALPGVGPALARRIVEDRDKHGPFGSVTGLQRVRGIGPNLAAKLAPHVTFSGVARPSPGRERPP